MNKTLCIFLFSLSLSLIGIGDYLEKKNFVWSCDIGGGEAEDSSMDRENKP